LHSTKKNRLIKDIKKSKGTFFFMVSGMFEKHKVQKNSIYLKSKYITNIFTVTFDQFNVFFNKLLNVECLIVL